jgi:hypothetical protein
MMIHEPTSLALGSASMEPALYKGRLLTHTHRRARNRRRAAPSDHTRAAVEARRRVLHRISGRHFVLSAVDASAA